MQVLQLRALRGPNIWTKKTALEALLQFDTSLDTESLAKQLANSVLELQVAAGCDVHFCTAKSALEANGKMTGKWQVIIEYSEEAVGRSALDSVLQSNNHCEDVINQLRDMDENLRLGPSTKLLTQHF
jgi:cyanophycin synthetase